MTEGQILLTGKTTKRQKSKIRQQETDFGGTGAKLWSHWFEVSDSHQVQVASQRQGPETFSFVGRSRPRLRCVLGALHSQRSVQREGGGWGKNPRMPVGVSGEEGERTVRGGDRRGCSVPEGRGGENCETEGVGLSLSAPPGSSGGASWGTCSAGQTPTGPEPL